MVTGERTGLLSICCLLFRPFLMWLFKAFESRGFKSSKLQSSSDETDMTAPQLSNSPQYCHVVSFVRWPGGSRPKRVTHIWRAENSH